nr:M64 family metallopeptidase [Odoribacter sp. OF09-27XD]
MLGLGDEYVGNVSYNDMYPLDVEPWEENLTTLVDFERKDWYRMLDAKTQIPTPLNTKDMQALGVYEGGGYVQKGVYRPWQNCLMNNLHKTDQFCPVCTHAIQKQIDFLCK